MLWLSDARDIIEHDRELTRIFKRAARSRAAKRANDSLLQIATTIVSIEVLARDFSGWGKRFPAAKARGGKDTRRLAATAPRLADGSLLLSAGRRPRDSAILGVLSTETPHRRPHRLSGKAHDCRFEAARSVVRPSRRPSLKTITEGRTLICVRLRTLVGKLRQAFFELIRAGLQTIGLAFGGIFRSSVRLGLSLRLRVGFRRMGRAAGNQKSNQNDQRTIHGLPHIGGGKLNHPTAPVCKCATGKQTNIGRLWRRASQAYR